MDTLICSVSAFRFWRVPPIVLLLAIGSVDDPNLRGKIDSTKLEQLQLKLATASPFSSSINYGSSWRRAGSDARRVKEALPLFAPWAQSPIDVLVKQHRNCHSSGLIHPCLWSADLPSGSTMELTEDISVTRPEFTMLQLASQVDLISTVLLASELCGSFSVYRAPTCIANALQALLNRGELPIIDGWQPSLSNGKLTDLWMRPPLIHPTDLALVASRSDSRRGCRRLAKAASLVLPGAASPFEVQTGMLLGLPRNLGGEGHKDIRHNERIDLSAEARLLAGRDYCLCDLYWESGLDVECQSAQHHDNADSFISDSDRTAALKLMGIEVLPVTFGQLKSARRFKALSHAVGYSLGTKQRPKTLKELEAAESLRNRVLIDWGRLPDLVFAD
ncbi:hypothetical protein [Paratractidigestivibacter sp.]|uniref:hypothetical protein n=1 Tax=Paratractidigestivibacter sp. TaxID=2847316 RepID=UPI002ABDCEB3|nr:hypothetical protein [Paratractidigestivibacter sp.]